MNRIFLPWFCLCTMQLAVISLCNAQNKAIPNKLLPPPAGIKVDGDLKEWGDSLRYYNQDKQLNYDLANTHDTLYMAIRITDRSEQIRVLRAGLTLSIDTRGKKKETFSITFPLSDPNQNNVEQQMNDLQQNADVKKEDHDDLMRARLTKLSRIKVTGFKDVESEMITTSNTYGFQTVIDYDKDDNLVYEAAIPLKFFHTDDAAKSEWAFNFKINGITRPGQHDAGADQDRHNRAGNGGGGFGGGGRGGRGGRGRQQLGGGSGPVDHSELSKSVDFWEKFYLADK